MAGSVHIPEEEAARDLSAIIDRALAGEEIHIRRGAEDVVVHRASGAMRTLGEILALARERKAKHGLAVPDDEFAADMEKIHAELNQPMDGSRWE